MTRRVFAAPRQPGLFARACLVAALASGTALAAGDASPPHSLGACGGAMVGADGQTYPCAEDRKPACDESGARCVCLEQLACGGTRDEPY